MMKFAPGILAFCFLWQPHIAALGKPAIGANDIQCVANISFAVAEDGKINSRVPGVVAKWLEKNAKKYPSVCFSQSLSLTVPNVLFVLATSSSVFSGFTPSVSSTTDTEPMPTAGSGTLTSSYGQVWNYTYVGTVTTQTTTTTQTNLPYTDTTHGLFLYAYDQKGSLIYRKQRDVTTREGGDPGATAGYNLATALGSMHAREHLIRDTLNDFVKKK